MPVERQSAGKIRWGVRPDLTTGDEPRREASPSRQAGTLPGAALSPAYASRLGYCGEGLQAAVFSFCLGFSVLERAGSRLMAHSTQALPGPPPGGLLPPLNLLH
jgi:hypothetical protein